MSLETRPVNTIGVTRALHITHHHTNHHCILSHLSLPRLFSVTGICDWRDHHHVTTGQATHVVSPGHKGHVTVTMTMPVMASDQLNYCTVSSVMSAMYL